jgi:hypothetical protein
MTEDHICTLILSTLAEHLKITEEELAANPTTEARLDLILVRINMLNAVIRRRTDQLVECQDQLEYLQSCGHDA